MQWVRAPGMVLFCNVVFGGIHTVLPSLPLPLPPSFHSSQPCLCPITNLPPAPLAALSSGSRGRGAGRCRCVPTAVPLEGRRLACGSEAWAGLGGPAVGPTSLHVCAPVLPCVFGSRPCGPSTGARPFAFRANPPWVEGAVQLTEWIQGPVEWEAGESGRRPVAMSLRPPGVSRERTCLQRRLSDGLGDGEPRLNAPAGSSGKHGRLGVDGPSAPPPAQEQTPGHTGPVLICGAPRSSSLFCL